MKKQLVAVTFLVLGLQGVAQANAVGSDSDGNFYLLPLSTYADQHAGSAGAAAGLPMDAEASFDKAPLDTYADRLARSGSEAWGVSKRGAESPFPSGGGYIDD